MNEQVVEELNTFVWFSYLPIVANCQHMFDQVLDDGYGTNNPPHS